MIAPLTHVQFSDVGNVPSEAKVCDHKESLQTLFHQEALLIFQPNHRWNHKETKQMQILKNFKQH